MTVELFGRVITAIVTPFAEDGSVNYSVAEKLAAHLAENGSEGIVVCGTTGESPTLTWSEEYELFQVVQKAVAGKAKVIAGTGSNSTREAIAATQKAAKLGLAGSLQVVPYYNKPPQAGLELHFRSIALACPELPIMLYNIPGRTGQNLQPETVAKLAEIDNIVGIKEASGNLDNVTQIRLNTPNSFSIYSGDDNLTLPILSVGGTGVVSVASHLVGDKLQKMIGSFFAGKTAEASKIHGQLSSLIKALFSTTNPIPIKAALQMQGWNVGSVRPPLCEIPPDLKAKLEKALKELALL
ncbi:MAG: 4-hydroxy-tetrahydrodipicolinate synthase [Oscillatoria sp. PMC 1068.18]|nr:4-hydroxy-tetrahydrodipicolinate synthase [Oscillatoria sp. PMC 1076.18]MEC4991314.1 4-hydroxy-tetrahydrodipicolinate synthase [Oscillatoria sp. PMC 1068.18]